MNAAVRFDFEGSVAIVTGAARGVGRALVGEFVRARAQVVAADRDEDGLAETCAPYGERVASIVADVSAPEGARAIVERATARFGRLDICVNDAAVAPHAALLDERVEVCDRVYAVNCRGTFLMTQAAARAMIAGGRGGRIINFSSGAAHRGAAGGAAYASSRAATESFSRVAAIELAPHGILVNTISPASSTRSRSRCRRAWPRTSRAASRTCRSRVRASRKRWRAWCSSWPQTPRARSVAP